MAQIILDALDGPVPAEVEEVPAYLTEVVPSIATALRTIDDSLFNETNVEPDKVEKGLIRYADGTNWNPGDGEGVYYYDGSAWNRLQNDTDVGDYQLLSGKDAASGYAGLDADKGITPGTTPATPGANILYKEGFIRGWVKFYGVDGTLRDSFNVDSVTDHSTGNFSVVWTTDFGDADYSIVNNCNTNAVGNQFIVREEAIAAGSVRLRTSNGVTATADINRVYVIAIGGQ